MARGRSRRAVSQPHPPALTQAAADAAFCALFGLECAAARQSTVLRQVPADIRDQLIADIAHRLEHGAWPCSMEVVQCAYDSAGADEGFVHVSLLDTTALRSMPCQVLAALHATLFCSRVDLIDYDRPLLSVLRQEGHSTAK